MTQTTRVKLDRWLSMTYQTLTIAGIIGAIIWWPISKRFEACEDHTKTIENIITSHCEDHKKKDQSFYDLQTELKVLNTILQDIKDQLVECKESDRDLRNRIYSFLTEMKLQAQKTAP